METIEPIEITASAAVEADALAASLAERTPSAGTLDALPFQRLSPGGRLDAAVAWERLVRHAQAGLTRVLGALAQEPEEENWMVESEMCAAMAWSPAAAQNRLYEAETLTRLFPETVQRLSEGRISVEQARSLAYLTAGLQDTAAQAVEARVLPRMSGQSMAVTRQAIRRAVLRADPEASAKRHQYERARRRVELRPEDDGMATVIPAPYTYGYEH